MSVLETPRLIFRGQVSWDPIVTNNYTSFYDEDDSQTVFDPTHPGVEQFRAAAIASVVVPGTHGPSVSNWNPDGTHRSAFFDTTVTAVDLGAGPSTDDPIVACPVLFEGMLVDVEPYGAFTSQLFFDEMSFGIPGGCRVFAPRTTRMTARYINFARNPDGFIAGIASVVWQTSFPKSAGLRIDPHRSPALAHLLTALESDDVLGLTVRWNAYRTIYFDTPDLSNADPAGAVPVGRRLQAKLEGGGFQPNPARSLIVGVLGLWRRGEPVSEPGDRALLTRQPGAIATAHVRFGSDSLTLDLSNSVPETGADLTKADLGELSVIASSAGPEILQVNLGSFGYDAYDRAAYERTAGLVTLKVGTAIPDWARRADLRLVKADGTVLLSEQALRAIPATPNTYLDEGRSTTLPVQVLERGAPAGAGVPVKMRAAGTATGPIREVLTDAQGVATFVLAGTAGNVEGFVLAAGTGAVVAGAIDPQITTYAYIRTLSADAATAALPPTWENLHVKVLRNWQAMAPCMDNWLDLGDPDQVRTFARILKKLTDPTNFEAYRFMPVTRDMTAGERTLLYRFLDAPPTARGMAVATAAAPTSPRDLSRSLRQA